MVERVSRRDYPWWVKVSLWGVPGRAGLWAFAALSVVLAVACIVYGFWDTRFFFGFGFLLSALMYGLSIRWIDRYGSWHPEAETGAAPDRGMASRWTTGLLIAAAGELLIRPLTRHTKPHRVCRGRPPDASWRQFGDRTHGRFLSRSGLL